METRRGKEKPAAGTKRYFPIASGHKSTTIIIRQTECTQYLSKGFIVGQPQLKKDYLPLPVDLLPPVRIHRQPIQVCKTHKYLEDKSERI